MNHRKTRRAFVSRVVPAAALIASVTYASPTVAQEKYPVRPIRMVVGIAAGGTTDLVARLVAKELGTALGQPIVVDNIPGAGGFIATSTLVKAAPDGYTLQFGTTSTNILAPLAQTPADANPVPDVAPLGVVGLAPLALFAHAGSGTDSVRELIDNARRNPGKLNYGSAGLGSTSHLAAELFKMTAGGLDIQHIPYKGGSAMDQAVMTGEVQFAFDGLSVVAEMRKSGRVKALAVMAEKRSKTLIDTPTAKEVGLGDFVAGITYYVFAPKKTPSTIQSAIRDALSKVQTQEAFRNHLLANAVEPETSRTSDAATRFQSEFDRWRGVVQKQNIKLN